MIKFNSENLKSIINNLNKLIIQYENNQLNLFNELKDSFNNWNDSNSVILEEALYLDKIESDNTIDLMKEYKNKLVFVSEKYNTLGKIISCDLKSKSSIIKKIEKNEEEINNIINEFYQIDNSFYYEEYQKILNQKQKIENSKIQLLELHNEIKSKYENIEKIETSIKIEFETLEPLRINDLDYQINQSSNDIIRYDIAILRQDLLEKNIAKLKLYIDEETKILNNFVKTLEKLNKGYVSTNVDLLKKNIDDFKLNIVFIFEKRNDYIEIFNNTIIKYSDLQNFVINEFEKEKK